MKKRITMKKSESNQAKINKPFSLRQNFYNEKEKHKYIIDLLNEGYEHFETNNDDETIILLGSSGDDKDILVKFISGHDDNLISNHVGRGTFSIYDVAETDSAIESQAIFAQFINSKDTNLAYYNCPGFNNTRSSIVDIVATYQIKQVVESSKKVKFIFVIDYQSVREEAKQNNFMQLAKHAVDLLENIDKFVGNVGLIVTRVDNTYEEQGTKNILVSDRTVIGKIVEFLGSIKASISLKSKQQNNESENLHNAKIIKLIDAFSVMKNKNYTKIGIFRRPDKAGSLDNIKLIQDSKKLMKEVIHNNVEYRLKSNNDFNYVVNAETKKDIVKLVEYINDLIIGDVNNIKVEIKDFYHNEEQKINDIDELYIKISNSHKALSDAVIKFNKWTNPVDVIKKTLKVTNELEFNISERNLLRILNYGSYLKYMEIINEDTNQVRPSDWIQPLQDAVNELNNSKKWYNFLIKLHQKLTNYEIQSEKSKFSYSNFKKKLTVSIKQQDIVKADKIKEFLDIMKIDIPEFDEIKQNQVDFVKLKFLNKIIDLTLKSEIITTCTQLNELELKGNFISIKDLPENFVEKACSEPLKQINLFGLHKIFIDDDIVEVGKKLQLAFISPEFEVIGNRNINLNGIEASSYEKAKNGVDGKPGLPGIPAGNFLVICESLKNSKNLKIYANGGDGGTGQSGGDGIEGKNGTNAITPTSSHATERKDTTGEKCLQDASINPFKYNFVQQDECRKESNNGLWLSDQKWHYYTIYGLDGEPGGNGGNGGVGGNGGYSGNIKIISNSPTDISHITVVSKNGAIGKPGLGGEGALGGRDGDFILAKHSYQRESYDIVYRWYQVTSYTGFRKMSGKSGENGINKNGILEPEQNNINLSLTINSYKNFLRENVKDNIQSNLILNFLNLLNTDKNIIHFYDTISLINELQQLENQYHKVKNDIDMIPSYQSLLDKILHYAEKPNSNEGSLEYKKVLAYLYTSTISKIGRLTHKMDTNLIIDLNKFLGVAQNDIKRLQQISNEKASAEYKEKYQEEIDKKIKEANAFIDHQIIPEIDRIMKEIDEKILKIVDEVLELQNQEEQDIEKLIAKKQELKRHMFIKGILGVYKVIASAVSFIGPWGAAACAGISAGVSIAEPVAINDQNDGNAEITTLPLDVKYALKNASKDIKNTLELFSKHLNEITEIIGDPTHEVLEDVSNEVARIQDILKKEIDDQEKGFDSADTIKLATESLNEVVEKSKSATEGIESEKSKIKISKVLDHVGTVIEIGEVGFEVYQNIKNDHNKIAVIYQAIKSSKSKLEQLKAQQNLIYDFMMPLCKTIQKDIKHMEVELIDQSHVSLDIAKWKMQTTVKDVRIQMQQLTKGFQVEDDLGRLFEKLSEALPTLIQVYDRIQNYNEQGRLAAYIVDISSEKAIGIRIKYPKLAKAINDIDLMIKANIIIETYDRAMNAFKQYVFPFARYHLKDIELPDELVLDNNITTLVGTAVSRIDVLKGKLDKNIASIYKGYDDLLHLGEFYSKDKVPGPFFSWKNKDYPHAISKLLDGQEVIFKADILKTATRNAIKFNLIDMNLKTVNQSLQSNLDNDLATFEISAIHLGDSFYKCGPRFYLIPHDRQPIRYSFARNENGEPKTRNHVYEKLKTGDLVISPYSLWSIKLINNTSTGFMDLRKYKNHVNLEFEGKGQYVIDDGSHVCDITLGDFYKEDSSLWKINHFTDEYSKEIDEIKKELNISNLNRNFVNVEYRKLDQSKKYLKRIAREVVQARSSAASFEKTSSINSFMNWFTGAFVLLNVWSPIKSPKQWFIDTYERVILSFNTIQQQAEKVLPQYEENGINSINFNQYDFNSTLALVDIIIRKFTKVKPFYSNTEQSINVLDVRAFVMNITDELQKQLKISCDDISHCDFLSLARKLEKQIMAGNLNVIDEVLREFAERNHLTLDKLEIGHRIDSVLQNNFYLNFDDNNYDINAHNCNLLHLQSSIENEKNCSYNSALSKYKLI